MKAIRALQRAASGSECLNNSRKGDDMDFEKLKELLKEAIDEGENLAEIMQITAEKIYQQGIIEGNKDHKE